MNKSNIHIAVLPFKVFSNKTDLEYLGDGLSEFIINKLSIIDGLRLTSSTSSFRFKNSPLSLKEISESLQAHVVVEGSVTIIDKKIKVLTNLIDPINDHVLWSQSWKDDFNNIIDLEEEISTEIAEKLRENFWHFDFSGFNLRKQNVSVDAYLHYLKGQYHYKKWNESDVNKAIDCFNKALSYEENYAAPLIGLANSYVFLAGTGYINPFDAFQKVNHYCDKAKVIAPNSSDLGFTLGSNYFWQDWQLKNAFVELNKVLESNPSHSESHTVLSLIYILIGKSLQANKHINIALQLDPLSPNKLFTKGWIAYLDHDYELAAKYCNQALSYSPKLMPAIVIKSCAQIMSGDTEAVIEFFTTKMDTCNDAAAYFGVLGLCYAKLEQLEKLDACKDKLSQITTDRSIAFQFLIYAFDNDHEKAVKWLRLAFDQKIPLLLFLIVDPLISPITQNADFIEIKSQLIKIRWSGLEVNETEVHITTKKTWSTEEVKRVIQFFEKEHPYLDAGIDIRKMATAMDIHCNKLSALINEEFGKNFNEFINGYRIELFKERIADAKYSHLSILGLALECGFNSKSSFNTAFKQLTGMTPKAYKNSIS
ncbi:helix-turn-helix domain-containing protein [bacterium SCSIO 12741]|nr:helix-turn-helix domain-containing protein [bacterium SCSIO 12741]